MIYPSIMGFFDYLIVVLFGYLCKEVTSAYRDKGKECPPIKGELASGVCATEECRLPSEFNLGRTAFLQH